VSTEPIRLLPFSRGRPVALTFDDGPDPEATPRIIEVLVQHGATATFFMVGEEAQAYPDVVEATVAAGMGVGVHGWDHANLEASDPSVINRQLEWCLDVLRSAGADPQLFRPPYGNSDAALFQAAAAHGLATVGWSVDPRDWRRPGVDAIVDGVRREVAPGAIVLLHDGGGDRSETVAALPSVLAALQESDLTVVDLLAQLLQ
jgi:peptidoglycan/xylan/chitin deacetylase (PgdA/CDA1 family)